eukprot:692797-Pyramimonas_sp.AAC.2
MESIILTPAAWPVTALPCSLSRCPSFTSVLHVSNYSVHTQEALPYSPMYDPVVIQNRTVEVFSYTCEQPHLLSLEGIGAGSIVVQQESEVVFLDVVMVQPFNLSTGGTHLAL